MQYTKSGNTGLPHKPPLGSKVRGNHRFPIKSNSLVITMIISSILLIAVPNAYAATIAWVNCPCSLNVGTADPVFLGTDQDTPIVRVTDATKNTDITTKQTVQVTITSSVDSVGIVLTLQETGVNTGVFENSNLALMSGNDVLSLTDTATITVSDTPGHGTINGAAYDFESIVILSDTDSGGITPIFTETGINTGTYTAQIRFGSTTVSSTNTLAASAGDIITVDDSTAGRRANGMIAPNPSPSLFKGAISAVVGQSVTAEYAGLVPVSFTVAAYPGPGRGGGGLVAPSLVIDVIASLSSSGGHGNGCIGDCTPPTLGIDDLNNRRVNSGFSYNGVPIDAELFYTHYPLIKTMVGKENNVTLTIYENEGVQNIKHVEMVFGLAKGQILDDSKAAIILDRISDKFNVTKMDPENALENIHYTNSTGNCGIFIINDCLVLTIFHTFRAPLDFNIVATEVWDGNRNTWQNYFNDGVEITGQSLNPPPNHIGIYKGNQIHIIETGKNMAVDNEGNTWTFDKEWTRDYKPVKKIDIITSHGYNRYDDAFPIYKERQELLAQLTMEKILAGKQIRIELPKN